MIISPQMEDAVERENLYFLRRRVAKGAGILRGNLSGDRNFSSKLLAGRFWRSGKREHVSRLVFAAESPVQQFHFCIRSDQHIHAAFKSGRTARTSDKPRQT
jgi:hypothetical protein